jgi:hypothetical protein
VRTGARASSTLLHPIQYATPRFGRSQPSRAARSLHSVAPKAARTASETGGAGRAKRRKRRNSDDSDDDDSASSGDDEDVEHEVGAEATMYQGAYVAYPRGHKLATAAPEFLAAELQFCARAAEGSFLVCVTYRYEHRDEVQRLVSAPCVCDMLLQRRQARPRDRRGGRNGE